TVLQSIAASFRPPPPTAKRSTLSLHDALPISVPQAILGHTLAIAVRLGIGDGGVDGLLAGLDCGAGKPARETNPLGLLRNVGLRSEEHTSELQSRENLVCRLLLEKKKHICSAS